MTPRAYQALIYIDAYTKHCGYPPSYREIATALDLRSLSTVYRVVNQLVARGYVTREGTSARSLCVVSRPAEKMHPGDIGLSA